MKRLNTEQVKLIHSDIIKASGGSDGIRDEGLLESAVNLPFQTFGGTELYPSLLEKAARLGYSLINNHPFIDGNKRIGTHTMLVFLDVNGVECKYEDEGLIETVFHLADGTLDGTNLLAWLQEHITKRPPARSRWVSFATGSRLYRLKPAKKPTG